MRVECKKNAQKEKSTKKKTIMIKRGEREEKRRIRNKE